MDRILLDFIDEAILLEINMAKLYSRYAEYFREDRDFWVRMELEERNHASILKTGRDFVKFNRFPEKILPEQITLLEESNRFVEKCLAEFEENKDREHAFGLALELEKSAGEAHFQRFMESEAEDSITNIFQRLNHADKDHAKRILSYWQSSNLNQGQ